MKTSPLLRLAPCAGLALATVSPLYADTFYWGSNTADHSWQDPNWFNNAAGTTPAGGVPGEADDAIFSITSLNSTALPTVRLDANVSVNSLAFNGTQPLTFTGRGGNRLITVGAGGIQKDGSGAITFGSTTSNQNVFLRFSANQTWTNTAAGTLHIRNSAASAEGAGAVILTLNAAGTGQIQNSGAYNDGVGSTLALIVESTGTGVVNFTGGNYSGGTTIRRGILTNSGNSATTNNNVGTGIVTFDAAVGNTATLRLTSTGAFANNFIVTGGGGTNVLEMLGSSGTLNGDIELGGNLTLGARLSGATGVTVNGDISGTGDLIKGQYQGGNSGLLTINGNVTTTGDLLINNGALTLSDTSAMTFYLGSNGDSNSIAGTTTGAVNINGLFIFNFSGTHEAGDTWTIVSLANEVYGDDFEIAGFTQSDPGLWTMGGYTFDQLSGQLTFIPEPSTSALFAGAGLLVFLRRRR